MKQSTISPDDPRLTAYALLEMEPAERAEFEQLLAQDAAARQAVAEIRAMMADLTAALEHEPTPVASVPAQPKRKPGVLLRFPQLYYVISGLAAACFMVVFLLQERRGALPGHSRIIEIPLAASPVAAREEAKAVVESSAPAIAPAAMSVAMGAAPADDKEKQGESIALSPFAVSKQEDAGYVGSNDLAVSRGRMQLKDATGDASQLDAQLMKETGAANAPALRYAGGALLAAKKARETNTEAYSYHADNAFLRVADQPLSTFSADVDTASYTNVRRFLAQGQRPPGDAVRIEELVNYFPYHYAAPTGAVPFAVALEVASAPWAPEHRLVRIGLKGREVSEASDSTGSRQARPAANLVFLLDVSGSMDEPNKLPLVKQSLRLLLGKLRPDDHVAIAVYAGASGLALPSTSVAHKAEILDAIESLEPAGSTNGAAGIQLAYDIAKANFIPGGVNRVILATDGDFNVGVASEGELVRLVQEKAQSGVFLSVLGFGMGNLKDATLEQLADKGNGNYAYIDSLSEAKKTLVEQAGGTLVTIAKDVKLQVEFNPAVVQAYRLIGYENRLLAKEDFNNDKVDAGEIGAGHTVTALYEIVPVGAAMPGETPGVDGLKYTEVSGQKSVVSEGNQAESRKLKAEGSSEMLTVKIRYKEPAGDVSNKLEFSLRDAGARFEEASQDFKFAAAVAAFGMELRNSPYKGTLTLADVAAWGRAGTGSDAGGYRTEFLTLVEQAQKIVQ